MATPHTANASAKPAGALPAWAQEAVLMPSATTNITAPVVKGYDFNAGCDMNAVLDACLTTGFQATALGQAVQVVNKMLDWTLASEPVADDEPEEFRSAEARQHVRCKVFLAFTSNMMSAGTRETIRYLCQHRMVQILVTTAGGVEEDFIKCLGDTFLGDFALPGSTLRRKGINRIGNLLIPNTNYCKFEAWMSPILDQMYDEQEQGTIWTPSTMIHRLGREINDPSSVYYWCYKNNIPVFCPALTDGAIGDNLTFFSYKRPGLILDLVPDVRNIDEQAINSRKTGVIILGGGLAKHHTLNANMMRNGADFTVYINTAQEFDGSDAGARPDEAKSWGKVRIDTTPVKVYADAALVFPILVGMTFARRHHGGLPVGGLTPGMIFDKTYTASELITEKKKLEVEDSALDELLGCSKSPPAPGSA